MLHLRRKGNGLLGLLLRLLINGTILIRGTCFIIGNAGLPIILCSGIILIRRAHFEHTKTCSTCGEKATEKCTTTISYDHMAGMHKESCTLDVLVLARCRIGLHLGLLSLLGLLLRLLINGTILIRGTDMNNYFSLRKRGLALFVALMMCLSLLPGTALAAEFCNHSKWVSGLASCPDCGLGGLLGLNGLRISHIVLGCRAILTNTSIRIDVLVPNADLRCSSR